MRVDVLKATTMVDWATGTRRSSAAIEADGSTSQRRLTNFAYLSALNELGGRTRQDLAQWPVFPWVLAFDSDAIDLGTGRDLSKPIGAQTEDRKALFLEPYETFEDPSGFVPKFMYGSHYSSAGVVLHYFVQRRIRSWPWICKAAASTCRIDCFLV